MPVQLPELARNAVAGGHLVACSCPCNAVPLPSCGLAAHKGTSNANARDSRIWDCLGCKDCVVHSVVCCLVALQSHDFHPLPALVFQADLLIQDVECPVQTAAIESLFVGQVQRLGRTPAGLKG